MIRHSLSDRIITFEKILDKNIEKLEATTHAKTSIREKVSTVLLDILFGDSVLVHHFGIDKRHCNFQIVQFSEENYLYNGFSKADFCLHYSRNKILNKYKTAWILKSQYFSEFIGNKIAL